MSNDTELQDSCKTLVNKWGCFYKEDYCEECAYGSTFLCFDETDEGLCVYHQQEDIIDIYNKLEGEK